MTISNEPTFPEILRTMLSGDPVPKENFLLAQDMISARCGVTRDIARQRVVSLYNELHEFPPVTDAHALWDANAFLDAVETGQVLDYGPMVTAPRVPPVSAVGNRRSAGASKKLARLLLMPVFAMLVLWYCAQAFFRWLRQ